MIMTTLYIILALLAGIWIGWKAQEIMFSMTFSKMLEESGTTDRELDRLLKHYQEDSSAEEPQLTTLEIRIEQHGDQLYAYRKSDDQFLGQGTDRDSLIDRLNQTMKPCRVLIDKEDGADLLQKSHS